MPGLYITDVMQKCLTPSGTLASSPAHFGPDLAGFLPAHQGPEARFGHNLALKIDPVQPGPEI